MKYHRFTLPISGTYPNMLLLSRVCLSCGIQEQRTWLAHLHSSWPTNNTECPDDLSQMDRVLLCDIANTLGAMPCDGEV